VKLSEIRTVLAERGIQLTKSLGQNFLHDTNQLARIVREAEVASGDQVLEIGPGLGPLTELLLANARHVLAIEKDRRLVEFLAATYAREIKAGRLALRLEDALEFLRADPGRDWRSWKVVSNLPYSVASPILVELAQGRAAPERITATLQLEVAQRLAASPGSPDYGLLTLLVQYAYEPRGFFRIPASCFFPEPDVDSACITLARRSVALLSADELPCFVQVVKTGFGQRRKMLFKNLKTHWPAERVQSAFERAGIPGHARAEALALEQFAALARFLAKP